MRRRLLAWTTLAVTAALVAGCAARMRVNAYMPAGMDLGQYRTYGWAPADELPTGDPRLDSNRFFSERVRAAVELELAPRGLVKVASGSPDLLVHYHARVEQAIESADLDRDYGRCATTDCRPYVYAAGTLLIDLIDPRTKSVVWRGWAEGSLAGAVEDQAWLEQTVDETVARILARFPARRP